MNRVAGEVVELMQSCAAEAEVELLWRPAPDVPSLVFDAEAIHRAVLNVVTNAIDAAGEAPGPGRVEISTEYASDRSVVRVAVRTRAGHRARSGVQACSARSSRQEEPRDGPGAAGEREDPQGAWGAGSSSRATPGKGRASRWNCPRWRPTQHSLR